MAWVDPRFRPKKQRPKNLKLNKFGETPCDIRGVVPTVRRPPPPSLGSSGSASFSGARALHASSASSRAPSVGSRVPSAGSRAPSAGSRAPSAGCRAPSAGARPSMPSTAVRPGTAASRPKSPARPPPLAPRTPSASCAPQQVGVSWRMHQGGTLRPPTSVRQLRAPTTATCRQPEPESCPPPPCPPDPCPSPQPAQQRPASRVASPRQRRIPTSTPMTQAGTSMGTYRGASGFTSRLRAPETTFSPAEETCEDTSEEAKSQKIILLPGEIDPTETTVITVEPPPKKKEKGSVRFLGTRSLKPEWVGPCPEPEPEPAPAAPQQISLQFSPPRRRLRAPRPCPPQTCPTEEPPCPQPEPPCPQPNEGLMYSRPCSPSPSQRSPCQPEPSPPPCPPLCVAPCADQCEEPYQRPCSPDPREVPCPPEPNPDDLWFDQMMYGPQPCPSEQSIAPDYSGNLVDITPSLDAYGGYDDSEPLPEDLIQWNSPQDPFSPPPPRCESPPPQCIDFAGKQDPFSPPTLAEYYARRYVLPQDQTEHPLWSVKKFELPPPRQVLPRSPSPLRSRRAEPSLPRMESCRRRSPHLVDREVLARSVPHNRHVSTICKDDSDEDLGLLPEDMMGLETDLEQNLQQPLTGARRAQMMQRDPLQAEPFEPLQYRLENLRRLRERVENVRAGDREPEEECQPPPRSTQYLEGLEACRRVMDRYQRIYEPPPCETDERGLEQMTLGDDIDFEAIDAIECD